jgi:hypothetical protein
MAEIHFCSTSNTTTSMRGVNAEDTNLLSYEGQHTSHYLDGWTEHFVVSL